MRYEIDPIHSNASFTVRHLGIASVRGHFTRFSGTIEFDEANPDASHVTASIDAASIDTRQEQRDAHLRSPDFLEVERFPTIDFTSTRVDLDGGRGKLYGDLTLHGVTLPVVLDVEFIGAENDPWGGRRIAFEATGKLNRKDHGLNYNQVIESGGLLVGDEVKIALDLEAVQRQPATAEAAATA
jgi:polyisoprenoid-binding protein YceI